MRLLLIPLFLFASSVCAGTTQLPVASDSQSSRAARQVDESSNGFTVVIPEGWVRRTDLGMPGVVLLAQATAKGRVTNCNIRSTYKDSWLDVSNAEFLQEIFSADDPSEILNSYKASGLHPQLLRSGRIAIAGEQAVFVELEFVTGSAKLPKMRTFIAQFSRKGFLYTLGCTDVPERYSSSLPEFGLFFSSFIPVGR
jgi:hypothetical protein